LYGGHVPESSAASLVEALLAAPASVSLLGAIEDEFARKFSGGDGSRPGARVTSAEQWINLISFGDLVAEGVQSARRLAGPWVTDAPATIARAYRFAPNRRALAEAIVARFKGQLSAPLQRGSQQWWSSYAGSDDEETYVAPLFQDLTSVYGNGEFPWNGLWTVTDPPDESHDGLVFAWDFFPEPVSRWLIPVREDARVFEIGAPEDWVELVEEHPKVATNPHFGWELPGPNQHLRYLQDLLEVPGQHAARVARTSHVLPDWAAVAGEYDGVHLSWAGFLTTEGFVSELDGGGVTMLRYWGSERTLWLSDVFGEPEPLAAPAFARRGGSRGADARRDLRRRDHDLRFLTSELGR
jgi:hypothetical protein